MVPQEALGIVAPAGPRGADARESSGTATVDSEGITVVLDEDRQLDVSFDGRRIWSFWLYRDGRALGDHRWLVRWPPDLANYLDGVTAVRVEPADGAALFDEEVRFGAGEHRIDVVDARGRPLGVDNSGRLVTTFETRDPAHREAILDSIATVVDRLAAHGVPAFLAYGTLLGAVRDRQLIGHDSDADVAYLSDFTEPVDVIRESFRLQRALSREGMATTRYSGAAFRVDLTESDGMPRGLDVFAGFFTQGQLALMGEIYQPFAREWMLPLSSAVLEGRAFPVPGRPERLLEAMYGPSWRRPDPAFKFSTPDSTIERFNCWFRGTRVNRNHWDRRYAPVRHHPPPPHPHRLARLVHGTEAPDVTVVDVGCGRGRDALWLAQQGRRAIGLDYSRVAFEEVSRARVGDLPVTLASLNLLELRSVLAWGARLARLDRPRVVLARHVLDALPPRGLPNFWRLCDMALRGGGRLYLQVLTHGRKQTPYGPALVAPVDVDALVATAERLPEVAAVEREDGIIEWLDAGYGEVSPQEGEWQSSRLRVQWR